MTSSSKVLTDNTPPLLSGASTEAQEPQSVLSVGTDNTKAYTPTMPKSSQPTKHAATTDERIRQHAEIAKVALKWLEKRGLITRYKVLSEDRTTVKEIRLVLSGAVWTENLDLKVLSDGKTVAAEVAEWIQGEGEYK